MNIPAKALIRGLVIGLLLIAAATLWLLLRPAPVPSGGQVVRTSGEALIGGPFALTNHHGDRVTQADFRGRLMAVYFGYTYCPDVCPLDMARLSAAVDILEARGADLSKLQVLFVTIDPARDGPQELAAFVSRYHPRFMGLGGTEEDIAKAAAAYKVYYAKVPGEGEEDYLMNHSNNIFIMGPEGEFLGFFSSLDTPQGMADRLARYIEDLESDGRL